MKAAREFFSEITDIDSRLVRTVIGLFRNPLHVVEASLEGQHTYTKPLRYLLFISTIFIVWRFLYEHYVQGLFIEQYPDADDWYLPERIAKAYSQFINLEDTFFPFQILLFVVPIAIIPLKLFFLRKSWREAYSVALYLFGQFWIILMMLIPWMVSFDTQILPILIAFGLTGFFFRELLSKKLWLGLTKLMALGYVLTLWFYYVCLPATQWGLVQIVLTDRRHEATEPTKPREEITLPVTEAVEFITRDPYNRFLNLLEKQDGLLVQCYQLDTTLLWQTLLPGVIATRKAVSVRLPSSELGILIIAYGQLPNMPHAILISAKGKILFTKIYQEEMVLNSGELVNETLVLTGGKSNGEGIAPYIDVFQLKFEPGKGEFELVAEHTHFLPEVGNRFDDLYAVSNSLGGLDLILSKYETTKARIANLGAMEINRVSIMRVKIDSTLKMLWETEIFKRNSKYTPVKDATFQMRYHPSYQGIVAFYSLADDRNSSAYLFSMDTLGKIKLQKKIEANELTHLTDVYPSQDGIYFCGWTHLGIQSPLLGFGSQGLVGFVSNDGDVSRIAVGKDRQGQYLFFTKMVADSSLMVVGERTHHILMRESEWKLMKFDRQLF
jgi:hypothetical protein